MKRVVMAMIIMALITGCAKVESANKKEEISRFVVIEKTPCWMVVADKETGVMYTVSWGTYNCGTFTLLVDADGNPLIHKGGQDESDN